MQIVDDYANEMKAWLHHRDKRLLQELQGEIDKLKGGYYPVSEFGNGADSVIQYDSGTLFYVHKIIDEKIEELSK